jgi:transposase
VFLIIDNAPYHWLPEDGRERLRRNRSKIELHRLPAYSPELNPMDPIWKVTRKRTTHNRFYATTGERDGVLRETFNDFQRRPSLIDAHVAVFR